MDGLKRGMAIDSISLIQPSGLPPQEVRFTAGGIKFSFSCDLDASTERDELSILVFEKSLTSGEISPNTLLAGGVILEIGDYFPPSDFNQIPIGMKVTLQRDIIRHEMLIFCGAAPYSIALCNDSEWFGEPQFELQECRLELRN